jgi:hypothetical protein
MTSDVRTLMRVEQERVRRVRRAIRTVEVSIPVITMEMIRRILMVNIVRIMEFMMERLLRAYEFYRLMVNICRKTVGVSKDVSDCCNDTGMSHSCGDGGCAQFLSVLDCSSSSGPSSVVVSLGTSVQLVTEPSTLSGVTSWDIVVIPSLPASELSESLELHEGPGYAELFA